MVRPESVAGERKGRRRERGAEKEEERGGGARACVVEVRASAGKHTRQPCVSYVCGARSVCGESTQKGRRAQKAREAKNEREEGAARFFLALVCFLFFPSVLGPRHAHSPSQTLIPAQRFRTHHVLPAAERRLARLATRLPVRARSRWERRARPHRSRPKPPARPACWRRGRPAQPLRGRPGRPHHRQRRPPGQFGRAGGRRDSPPP